MSCLVFCMTLMIYAGVRNHTFISYDDDRYITENRQVKSGISAAGALWAFTTLETGNWHPLTWLSHQLDMQLFGLNPGAHHLMNLVLHLLNTQLLFITLRRMTRDTWKSCFVSALFALHPLHVESVAWAAERKDVLSACFWMLSLLSYISYTEGSDRRMYLLTFFFFMLGLLSKPMVVTLPFVFLLLDFWPLQRIHLRTIKPATVTSTLYHKKMLNLLGAIKEKIPFLLFSLLASAVAVFAQHTGNTVGSFHAYPLKIRLANAIVAYIAYIAKMFWPAKLAVLYPHPGSALPLWKISAALGIFILISVLVFKYSKKYPWFIVGWLWYLVTLLPVIGLIQVGVQAMADRYTYLPMIGLFVIIAWGIPCMVPDGRLYRIALSTTAMGIALLLSMISWIQLQYWKDSFSLYQHAIQVTENNYILHNNLGFELQKAGLISKAAEHYHAALRIRPDFAYALLNMGVILARRGNFEAAIDCFKQALRTKPNFFQAHLNIGNSRLRQGRAAEALKSYAAALQLDPYSASVYNGIGGAMAMLGKKKAAISYFEKAIRLDHGNREARYNLKKTSGGESKFSESTGGPPKD